MYTIHFRIPQFMEITIYDFLINGINEAISVSTRITCHLHLAKRKVIKNGGSFDTYVAVYQRVIASNTVVEQNSIIDLIDLISSYSYISCVIVDSCDLMR